MQKCRSIKYSERYPECTYVRDDMYKAGNYRGSIRSILGNQHCRVAPVVINSEEHLDIVLPGE